LVEFVDIEAGTQRKSCAGWLALALTVLCGMIWVVPAWSASGQAHGGSGKSLPGWVLDFPLWKVLPSSHFARLGEGVVNRRRWAIYTFAKGRSASKGRPCIEEVGLRYEAGVLKLTKSEASCGGLAPPQATPVTTENVLSNVPGVIVGMTLANSVKRVTLDFSNRSSLDTAARSLTSSQAAKARVRQFRYVAVGLVRKACLEDTKGFSSSGVQLFETTPLECVT
jgi:hypothetical protein